MSVDRPSRITDEQLREALSRRPNTQRMAGDLDAIMANVERTRQGRATPTRWLLLAAALVALALLAATLAIGSRPHRLPGVGLIAFDAGGDIWTANPDGSQPHQLTTGSDLDWQPLWSPDGTKLVYWSTGALAPDDTCGLFCLAVPRRLMLLDLSSKDAPRSLIVTTVDGHASWRVSWAPDSRRLAFSDEVDRIRRIFVLDVDTLDRVAIGPPELDGWDPTWSPDGRLIGFVRGHLIAHQRGLYVMAPDGSGFRRLTSIPSRGAGFDNAVWSPDGDRLAFAAETEGADPFQKDIWVVGLDGSPEVDISNDPADESQPGWSPDGKHLGYLREMAPGQATYQVVVSGGAGEDATMVAQDVAVAPVEWSADSTRILGRTSTQVIAIDARTGSEAVVGDGRGEGVGSWQQLGP